VSRLRGNAEPIRPLREHAVPKRLNVAIIGCGWVSDWHARDGLAHLPDLFRITACCDTEPERLKAFA
jgi:predicted dehydrogenase